MSQEEQEKDGIRGVTGITREGWFERCCKEEREKDGKGKDGIRFVAGRTGEGWGGKGKDGL